MVCNQDLCGYVPMTLVEGLKRRVNKHLHRWLGIPPSFTSVGLYIRSGQLQLLLSSVVEFKVAKYRAVMMYRDSGDEKIRGADVTTRAGHKWAADAAVAQAERRLKLNDMIGSQCMGRQGLRTTHFQQWGKADLMQRREMIQAKFDTWRRKSEGLGQG